MKKVLLQLNEKSLYVMGIAILAVITIMGVMLSLSPIVAASQTRAAETAKLEAQKLQTVSNVEKYTTLEKYEKELDKTADILSYRFPDTSDVPGVINDISKAAVDSGMDPALISNITVSQGTQIVEPLGESGENICGAIKPGEFGKILPDPKNSTAETKIYVFCTETPITNLESAGFYNAATKDAARNCKFKSDAKEGTEFVITVTDCSTGIVMPALKAGAAKSNGMPAPAKPILANIEGQVAQMAIVITIGNGATTDQIASFVNNLYGMNRAITISSVKVGVSQGRGEEAVSTISGFIYSHTKVVKASDISSAESGSK